MGEPKASPSELAERYRLIFEKNPLPMWVFDARTLRFLAVNAATVAMYGWSRAEFLGMKVPDLRLPEDLPELRRLLRKARPDPALVGVVRHRRKDGKVIRVEITASDFVFEGRPAVLSCGIDVTERLRVQEDLRKSQEGAQQSQRLEAVGRLAGGVAHDFNNLLGGITGYAELLLASFAAGDPRREDASELLKTAQRAASLTRQLLAFSRRQTLAPRPVDLGAALIDMRPLLQRLAGKGVELSVIARGASPRRVMVDPGQLQQILLNLTVNAADAMPKGGRLSFETGEAERMVELIVADTGSGMRPEILAHVFEPFFTTKPRGKGTGLGLSTVYGIVRQSGGRIAVASEPGRGSTFRVLLPKASARRSS